MRHLRKRNNLNRAADQQRALMRSLSRELILHGQIKTTLSKAKVLRPVIEKILTKAIKAIKATEASQKLHYVRLIRRDLAADILQPLLDKAKLLTERPGGYIRILKAEDRRGDNTQLAIIQILSN